MLHKSSFLIEAAVANQSGAMEADTISKNGESSKSHVSRGKSLIKAKFAVLFLMTSMMFGLGSCEFFGNAIKSANSSMEKDAKKFAELYWECAIAEHSFLAGLSLELFFIVDDCLSDEFVKKNETGSSVKCKEFAGFMKKMKAKYNDKSNEFTILVKKEMYNIHQRGTK